MKKSIVLLTALLAGVFALPAFAEQLVGRVQVDISPNEDTELEPGATYSKPSAVAMDSGYTVSDYSVDGRYNTPKKPYTYSITVRADEGQFFDSSTVVEVRGAYEMAVTERVKIRFASRQMRILTTFYRSRRIFAPMRTATPGIK